MRWIVLAIAMLVAQNAVPQVGLPAVRLPSLPAVGAPGLPATGLLPATGDATRVALEPRRLEELRRLRVRELLRRHPDLLETDPQGELIVRGELVVLSPDPAQLQAAAAAGFTLLREQTLAGLGTRIVVLHAPGRTARSLEQLERLDPSGTYDFNHVYLESGAPAVPQPQAAAAPSAAPAAPADAGASAPAGPGRLGLIDSGVDAAHGAFRGLTIHQHGCTDAAVPAAHGTAVASLMVGRAGAFHGAAAGAELYAADVFCGAPTGGAADSVAEAFAWLVGERVAVINVSLVGPANRMLASVVENVIARGYLVVAAVGNDGPAAPPLYPAAWPGVIGVTAVDLRRRVLPEAERGPQVKFAAPGADMVAAKTPRGYALVRGTSFAAPIVAGLLGLALPAPGRAAAERALADLERRAIDLGAPGPDPVYGYGLVGAEVRPPAALASRD